MSKYDKMLELNKRKSEEKVERAVLTIRTMVLEREKVSVPALMQKTGLSRGFFYKNPIVRGEIDAAMEQQAGMVDPTQKEIAAIITHVAFYAGWPKGWAVFNLAKEVWNEDEAEK